MAIKDPLTHNRSLAYHYEAAGNHFCRAGMFRDARHMYERQVEALERDGAPAWELVFPLLSAAEASASNGSDGASRKFHERAFAILSAEFGGSELPRSELLKRFADSLSERGQLRESAEIAVRIQAFLARENGRV